MRLLAFRKRLKNFDYVKGVKLLNETIRRYNEASELKGYQDATKFFISNCYQAGIIYEDR